MTDNTDIWELRRGEILIGWLTVLDQDMTWYSADFEPTPEYETYRAIIELGSSIRNTDDAEAWNAWMESMRGLGLRLIRLRDQVILDDFLLYIDGDIADFRPRFDS